jgi:peptide/nickel transport system permease protein
LSSPGSTRVSVRLSELERSGPSPRAVGTWGEAAARLLRDPQGLFGLVVVLVFVGSAAAAPLLAPFDPDQIDIRSRMQGPSPLHWLGTDQLGRDTLSRVLFGGRIALTIAIIGIGVSLSLGLVLGIVAGYGPRWLDSVLLLVMDAVRSFPAVIMAMAVVALTGPSLGIVLVIIIMTSIPSYARLARTSTLALKNAEFIEAERSLGATPWRIMLRHVMPNIAGPLLILGAMDVPVVVTVEAGLSFLGLGVLPPTASWGTILNEGYLVIRDTPWPVIAGGVPLVLTTLGFTFLGESLRDVLDPRLRGSR